MKDLKVTAGDSKVSGQSKINSIFHFVYLPGYFKNLNSNYCMQIMCVSGSFSFVDSDACLKGLIHFLKLQLAKVLFSQNN